MYPPGGTGAHLGTTASPLVTIRRAGPEDLPAACRLLTATLGFSDADGIPAWLMRTTDECGGLTLVATSGDRVVGASYAFPARDGLFSCGLAVAAQCRGRRLGRELKLAQRREALALGYRTIRWTTDPLNGRALRVYLAQLGARVTGYRAGLHDGLRTDPGHPLDDLELVWQLAGAPPVARRAIRTVELPWAAGRAELEHRRRVRREMSDLLDAGYVGSGCELDRAARRCHVVFARELA
jgi:ribosomal protein S18 acetylase RimI-like enzyme